jgi:hypothetical protein
MELINAYLEMLTSKPKRPIGEFECIHGMTAMEYLNLREEKWQKRKEILIGLFWTCGLFSPMIIFLIWSLMNHA